MLLLVDAKAIAADFMDNFIVEGYGIDIDYAKRCKRMFVVTVNDWTGEEVHFRIGAHTLMNHRHLLVWVHDACETLRARES